MCEYLYICNEFSVVVTVVCVCVRAFCFVSFHFVIFLFFRSSENRISNNDPFVQIHRKLTQLHTFNNTAHTMRRECIGSHLSDAWMVMRMAQSLSIYIYFTWAFVRMKKRQQTQHIQLKSSFELRLFFYIYFGWCCFIFVVFNFREDMWNERRRE